MKKHRIRQEHLLLLDSVFFCASGKESVPGFGALVGVDKVPAHRITDVVGVIVQQSLDDFNMFFGRQGDLLILIRMEVTDSPVLVVHHPHCGPQKAVGTAVHEFGMQFIIQHDVIFHQLFVFQGFRTVGKPVVHIIEPAAVYTPRGHAGNGRLQDQADLVDLVDDARLGRPARGTPPAKERHRVLHTYGLYH